MNTKNLLKNALATAVVLTVGFTVIPAHIVFAETKVSATSVKKTESTPTVPVTDSKLIDTEKVEEVSSGIFSTIKKWFIGLYYKVDAWRANQAIVWGDIKKEKEAEVATRTGDVEANRDNRVNRILNEEQTTLFNGAGTDLKSDGNIFLLRLYTFALFIFVIIFTTPIIFYGIITLVIIAILNKIIQKMRNPQAY